MNSAALDATSPLAFELKYRSQSDPWNFRHSAYEQNRYQKILESLRRPCYAHAFEPGCSVGELTASLAERCGRVTATDVSQTALGRARVRCHRYCNIEFQCSDISQALPASPVDLIVLSEIAYYFPASTLAELAQRLQGMLSDGGELLACHWLGHSEDHVLHGDEAHEILLRTFSLRPAADYRFDQFRIDSWINA